MNRPHQHAWNRPGPTRTLLTAVLAALLLALPAAAQQDSGASNSDSAEEASNGEQGISPDELTVERVRTAIEKAIEALRQTEPVYTFRPERHYGGRGRGQRLRHQMGDHALATWAMLAAGQSYQQASIQRRMNWVLSRDAPYTYDRGMRAQMLHQLPIRRWEPWIRRDGVWLTGALSTKGNFPARWAGGESNAYGDHANGQYGALGLWGLAESGYAVPNKTWQAIDQHWRSAQTSGGGWRLGPNEPVSGPMTAGGAAVLSITERYLYGQEYANIDADRKPHLRRGLEWLDQNFSLEKKAAATDFFYYMWTVQSVGRATGWRTFNGIDWFRTVTARLLNEQGKDGFWRGPKGRMLSTGFALMYMARAMDPVAVSKVKFDGNWNNRPHDLRNFVGWASDQYETPLIWQIVDPSLPMATLMESRMLYLASDRPVQMTDAQKDGLRRYIENGGLLLVAPEGNSAGAFVSSAEDLLGELLPDRELKDAPDDSWMYRMHHKINRKGQPRMIHNGIRPLAVVFRRDLSEPLQTNAMDRLDVFRLLSNLYLQVTGKDFDRPRIQTHYIPEPKKEPEKVVRAARIKHGGEWNPEPAAMRRLRRKLARDHGIDLKVDRIKADQLGDHRIAFLTTVGQAEMSGGELSALRTWLKDGGKLWLDAAGGSLKAGEEAQRLLQELVPGARPGWIATNHRVISGEGLDGGYNVSSVAYRRLLLQRFGMVERPRLSKVRLGGHDAIFYSSEDLTAGWAGLDHWGIYGYQPGAALKLGVNGVLDAITPREEPAATDKEAEENDSEEKPSPAAAKEKPGNTDASAQATANAGGDPDGE